MSNFELYQQLIFANGTTQNIRNTQILKNDFINNAINNPSYTHDKAYRNGEVQQFLITQSATKDKANLITFPDEDITIGDMIYYNNMNWIVYEVSQSCEWQKTAVLWLCNIKLRFQIGTSEIHERWAVLDSGVYSTTITGDKTVQIGDKQYNLWITKDEVTKYIYTDKRLAIGKKFNKDREEILDVYSVTAVDAVSKNYGDNAHIIKISLRDASNFNSDTDNVDEMICDIVDGTINSAETINYCKIIGRNKIRLGETISLVTKFYENNIEVEKETSWKINPSDNFIIDGNSLKISIPKDDSYIGIKYLIEATEKDTDNFGIANHVVEVV